jgi:hypothetical protein
MVLGRVSSHAWAFYPFAPNGTFLGAWPNLDLPFTPISVCFPVALLLRTVSLILIIAIGQADRTSGGLEIRDMLVCKFQVNFQES